LSECSEFSSECEVLKVDISAKLDDEDKLELSALESEVMLKLELELEDDEEELASALTRGGIATEKAMLAIIAVTHAFRKKTLIDVFIHSYFYFFDLLSY
jgi:hypothetical protein